jgi:hypothetical protein
LQTVEEVVPSLYERVNASARVLLKLYRESAFAATQKGADREVGVKHVEHQWEAALPDIKQVKLSVDSLIARVEANLRELTLFGDRFEKEVAATLNDEIEKIAEEARSVAK